MKRLSKFEVESLVNVVMSKLEKIENEKIEKNYGEFISKWNEELLELDKEVKIWANKFKKKQEQIRKEIKEKGWRCLEVNDWSNYVKIQKCDLVGYEVRNKIMDEIVINSLKENDIDSLLDSLVDKFKS